MTVAGKKEPKQAIKRPLDIDEVCQELAAGQTMTAIARENGWAISRFLAWVEADADRSARVKAARQAAARMWDERATEVIEAARDPFELSKAKELAHHYRWRAKAIAPKEYGDKVAVDMDARVTSARQLSTDELMAIAMKGSPSLCAAHSEPEGQQ